MSCFSLDTTAYFAFTSISLTTYFSFILDFIFLSSFSLLTYTIHSYLGGKYNMIYLPYTVIFPLFHPQKWDSNTDRGWSKAHLIYTVLKSSFRSLCLLLVMALRGVWHSRIHATRKNSSMEWDIPHLWDTSHQGRIVEGPPWVQPEEIRAGISAEQPALMVLTFMLSLII